MSKKHISTLPCTYIEGKHAPPRLRKRNRAAHDPAVPSFAGLILVAVFLGHLPRLPALAAKYPVIDFLVLRQWHFVGDVDLLDDLSQSFPSGLEDVDVLVVGGWKPDLADTPKGPTLEVQGHVIACKTPFVPMRMDRQQRQDALSQSSGMLSPYKEIEADDACTYRR